jgi:hypothetical protein
MKNMSSIIYVLIFLFVLSCGNNEITSIKNTYDVQISYSSIPVLNNEELPNDTLLILFDGNFNKDTVSVIINNRHFKDVILTTDKVTGLAGHMNTIDYDKVENIGFRINNGKLILIEPEERQYNIRLTYSDSLATIRFYRLFPGFM